MQVQVAVVTVALSAFHPAIASSQQPEQKLLCTPADAVDTTSIGFDAGTPSPGTLGFTWGGSIEIRNGLSVVWEDYPIIRSVLCDGPAHRAGIRAGDTMLEIENANARTAPFPVVIPGRSYRLRLRRNTAVLEVTLRAVRREG